MMFVCLFAVFKIVSTVSASAEVIADSAIGRRLLIAPSAIKGCLDLWCVVKTIGQSLKIEWTWHRNSPHIDRFGCKEGWLGGSGLCRGHLSLPRK